ncbi:MAG: hypothetical protein ABSF12_04205 [Bryobacteraceae bacterium]|jgi:hypothetical protein
METLDREILSRDFYECWQEPCSDIEPFLRVKGSAPHTWTAGHGRYRHVSVKSALMAFYDDDHAFEWSVEHYKQDRAFYYARNPFSLHVLQLVQGCAPRLLLRAANEPDKSRPQVAKFLLEQQWVETHRDEFAGKWVALEGECLLASGDSAKIVYRLALDMGALRPLVLKVEPSNQPPFAGW